MSNKIQLINYFVSYITETKKEHYVVSDSYKQIFDEARKHDQRVVFDHNKTTALSAFNIQLLYLHNYFKQLYLNNHDTKTGKFTKKGLHIQFFTNSYNYNAEKHLKTTIKNSIEFIEYKNQQPYEMSLDEIKLSIKSKVVGRKRRIENLETLYLQEKCELMFYLYLILEQSGNMVEITVIDKNHIDHSKLGGLLMYATIHLNEEIKSNIIPFHKVVKHD